MSTRGRTESWSVVPVAVMVMGCGLWVLAGCAGGAGGGGGGGGADPCAGVVCDPGQQCNPATGACEAEEPVECDPPCGADEECVNGTCQPEAVGGGDAEAGQITYEGNCMSCHGDPGMDNPPVAGARDLFGEGAEEIEAQLTGGEHTGGAFEELGTDDYANLAAFLAGTGEMNENADEDNENAEEDNENADEDNENAAVEREYAGTDTCLTCHGATAITGTDYSDFVDTGHPFKLNVVEGGTAPIYPVTTLPGPPEGLEWDDVSFVIGGYRYKYRVIDSEGFIVLGPTAQYNFPTQDFTAYDNNEDHTDRGGNAGPWDTNIGRKEYSCGKCHTTGYDEEAENHHGLEGLVGDWAFEGIQCEECHGPGQAHVDSMSADDIISEISSETVCGKCHTRNVNGIVASGGFVKHHEQWDEFSRTKHGSSPMFADGCATCHDVHQPLWNSERLAAMQAAAQQDDVTAIDALAGPPGIIAVCTDCHSDGDPATGQDMTVTHEGSNKCTSCHMAFTTKSMGVAVADYMGDVRSHAWQIEADPAVMMFTDGDGNPVPRDSDDVAFAALDENQRPFITLDFACLRCHPDWDLATAAEKAASIHGLEAE